MALNIFSASFISRSPNNKAQRGTGQNSIEHAAYCRREKLIDERTGKTYDGLKMGKGQEAEWKDIYVPQNAPAWMRDPSRLWNELEKREDQSKRRATALLNRSWIMTFPKELTSEQRIWVAKDFMKMVAREGWVIDGAIHGPDKDNTNWHMHANLPMRDITEDGFGNRRTIGHSVKGRNAELADWKDKWADINARQLERSGHKLEAEEFRYGHLKLSEQRQKAYDRHDYDLFDRLDRFAQIHVGPAAKGMDARGESSFLGEKNKLIIEENVRMAVELEADYKSIKAAYQKAVKPQQFVDELKNRTFVLARVTEQDKFKDDRARKKEIFASAGEYVAVSQTGRVYHLTPNSTGDTRKEIARFLEPLAKEHIPSVSQAKDIQKAFVRQQRYFLSPRGSNIRPGRAADAVLDGAARMVEGVTDTVLGLFESKGPTPAQQLEGEKARQDRLYDAEEAERRRKRERESGRDR